MTGQSRRRVGGLALCATIVLAACGGGPPATAGGPGATPGGPGATTGSNGGGFDACPLLTGDEAAGVLHTAALTPTAAPGDPARCSYALPDGEEVLTVDVLGQGAATQFQAFVDAGSVEEVTGVGDRALFEPSSRRLVFLVGDQLVYLHSRSIGGSEDTDELFTPLALIIAARLSGGPVPTGIATPPPIATAETACDLISPDEAATVLGKGPMSSAESGSPLLCTFSVVSSGEVVMSTYFQRVGGGDTWGSYESSLTTDPVEGLGEKAMFEPSTGILFVLQGDSIFNVNVYSLDPAGVLDVDRQLAEIMLTHL